MESLSPPSSSDNVGVLNDATEQVVALALHILNLDSEGREVTTRLGQPENGIYLLILTYYIVHIQLQYLCKS